jgi:hypothetical protein
MFPDALAEASDFIGVGGVPRVLIFGVTAKLLMLQGYTWLMSKDWGGSGRHWDVDVVAVIIVLIVSEECKLVVV